MDHQFHKPAQPWEKSEGSAALVQYTITTLSSYYSCVHLLAELSQIKECQSSVTTILPLIADSTRHKQYTQHYNYIDTLLKLVIHTLCMLVLCA